MHAVNTLYLNLSYNMKKSAGGATAKQQDNHGVNV